MIPCPFCGSEDIKVYDVPVDINPNFRAVCGNLDCQAEGPAADTDKEAIEKWGRRIP